MTFLVTGKELLRRLGEPGLVVVDVRPAQAFAQATIPGAISLNVYDYFIPSSDEAGIRDLEAATARAFAASGIDRCRTVVYFEEDTGMISPRGLWFHDYAGLPGGAILDGGMAAWQAAGGPVEPGNKDLCQAIVPVGPDNEQLKRMRREFIATTREVAEDHGEADILDVRRRSEFEGTFVHPCCARAGRIPGARFLFWEDLISCGRYRDGETIAALAAAAGLSPQRRVITYCHRGARAATGLYGLKIAGYQRLSVFVGSWHEWSARTDLPIESDNHP